MLIVSYEELLTLKNLTTQPLHVKTAIESIARRRTISHAINIQERYKFDDSLGH